MANDVKFPRVKGKLFVEGGRATFKTRDIGFILDGYQTGASLMIEYLLRNGRDDSLIHPVLYLYRHEVELAMKRQIDLVHRLNNDGEQAPRTHHLQSLWYQFQSLVHNELDEEGRVQLDIVGSYVMELHEMDARGLLFRYVDHDPAKQFNLSIENLRDRMEEVHNWLCALYDWWENTLPE